MVTVVIIIVEILVVLVLVVRGRPGRLRGPVVGQAGRLASVASTAEGWGGDPPSPAAPLPGRIAPGIARTLKALKGTPTPVGCSD